MDARSIFSAINSAVAELARRNGAYPKVRSASIGGTYLPLSGGRTNISVETHPPLVLSVFLQRMDRSPRWKEVVEPKPGRFTHHLEINRATEVDHQVREWLREAWTSAT